MDGRENVLKLLDLLLRRRFALAVGREELHGWEDVLAQLLHDSLFNHVVFLGLVFKTKSGYNFAMEFRFVLNARHDKHLVHPNGLVLFVGHIDLGPGISLPGLGVNQLHRYLTVHSGCPHVHLK